MDPAYLYRLPLGSSLFRAATKAKEGRWYALTLEDTYIYGNNTTEYSTTKELKLLNLMSLTFHNDLMDRLLVKFPGKDNLGIDNDKIKCLIAIGLFDFNLQNVSHGTVFGKIPIVHDNNWDIRQEWGVQMLHNRHRFSEHENDTRFVSILEELYGNYYDGYIIPVCWPSKLQGGYFGREVFLFKIANVKEVNSYIRSHTIQNTPSFTGGAENNTSKYAEFISEKDLQPGVIAITREMMEKGAEDMKRNPIRPLWNSHEESPIPPPMYTSSVSSNTINHTNKKRFQKTRKQRK